MTVIRDQSRAQLSTPYMVRYRCHDEPIRPTVIPAPDADLCLAFANTRYWRGTATPTEDLNGRRGSAALGRQRRSGCRRAIERIASLARRERRSFEAAIALRETIFRCFAATASRARAGRRGPRRAECRTGRGTGAAARAPRRLGHRHAGAVGQRAAGAGAMVGGGPAGRDAARSACGSAPIPTAAGCSSTTARAATGAGAR